jgi:hypothetical protein
VRYSGRPGGVVVIDHHRLGDPGYGVPPAQFLIGSSLGQVLAELARLGVLELGAGGGQHAPDTTVPGAVWSHTDAADGKDRWFVSHTDDRYLEIPSDLVLAAAADHCLQAAYRGECPGVDPELPTALAGYLAARSAEVGAEIEVADAGEVRT